MNEPLINEKVATTEAKRNTNDDALMVLTLDDAHPIFNCDEIQSPKESLALSDEAKRLRSINLMKGMCQLGAYCQAGCLLSLF